MDESLRTFIANCESVIGDVGGAAERVTTIAPLMQDLVAHAESFLSAEHTRSESEHYARNAIYIAPRGNLSLFALVWRPGQWTPVHDHGSWGVVGIVRGVLEERSYMSASGDITSDSGIRLKRGGVILLNPGSVSSFVPNPDHIHMTGVPEERETCIIRPQHELISYLRRRRRYAALDRRASPREPAVSCSHSMNAGRGTRH